MILVTGATGNLGSALTPLLLDAGQEVRGLSRRERAGSGLSWVTGDLRTGENLDHAIDGADVIVHAATDGRPSRSGDLPGTRQLLDAIERSGAKPHLVYISIVGIDDHPYGYFQAKAATERLIVDSGVPYTILRTTQWHQLLDRVLRAVSKSPVVPVPSHTQVQPLDVSDAALRTADLALNPPAGRVPDLGGPEIYDAGYIVRSYLQAAGKRRALLPVRLPGATGAATRAGRQLTPDHCDGKVTWPDFLTANFR